MSMQLKNGDYLPDGQGGFVTVSGPQELQNRVLFKLSARRGACPLLPNLGSQLHRLPQEKQGRRSALAKQYVEQALQDEEDLEVEEVLWDEEEGHVSVCLRWQTERFQTTLSL